MLETLETQEWRHGDTSCTGPCGKGLKWKCKKPTHFRSIPIFWATHKGKIPRKAIFSFLRFYHSVKHIFLGSSVGLKVFSALPVWEWRHRCHIGWSCELWVTLFVDPKRLGIVVIYFLSHCTWQTANMCFFLAAFSKDLQNCSKQVVLRPPAVEMAFNIFNIFPLRFEIYRYPRLPCFKNLPFSKPAFWEHTNHGTSKRRDHITWGDLCV